MDSEKMNNDIESGNIESGNSDNAISETHSTITIFGFEIQLTPMMKKVFEYIFILILELLFSGFFLYFYLESVHNNTLKNDNFIGILIIISLWFCLIEILLTIRGIFLLIINYKLPMNEYKIIENGSVLLSSVVCFLKLLSVIKLFIFVIYFIPFTHKNCHGLSINMCFFPRYYAVLGMIMFTTLGLHILISMFFEKLNGRKIFNSDWLIKSICMLLTYIVDDKRIINYHLEE